MAQSICVCPASFYEASAFRIYSSMVLRDDLLAGESYYIAETKSFLTTFTAKRVSYTYRCCISG